MANQQSDDEKKGNAAELQALSIWENEKKVDARLREVLGNESLASFSRRCGISEGGLRKYLEGASPSTTNLIAMADTANVNIEWLAAGRGPKMRGDSIVSAPAAPTSGTTCFSEEDLERLIMAITTVEEALESIGSKLSADKRGHLIAAAYDILEDMDQKANVIKFIKLAA